MPFQTKPQHTFRKVGPLLGLSILVPALATLHSLSSAQQSAAANASVNATLRVTGEVRRLLVLKATDLRTLRRQTVAVSDDKGGRTLYEGVPVAEVLRWAGVPLGKQLRGSQLKLYVLVAAADGYSAVFALPEFDPDFTDQVILLADRRDGRALSGSEGPFRIIVPAEKRHAR